ncbi:MAG: ABC transporter ATP-binding protein, partial [Clostridiales bacterium]|nr:ABC transporter ATP-binding protein [Clostridiales bacterium]
SSFLILDDITSSVDMETEREIQKSLKTMYGGRTTFIVSHRISSVKDADIIIVLDRGKIIESGSHEDLLSQKGYYYNTFIEQAAEAGYC